MSPKVSIIIVNFNTFNLVVNCIKSIIAKTKSVSYQIIVIDNNSNDDISKLGEIEEFKNQHIQYHKLSKNLGFGKANNEGIKYSSGQYILFLNPDTIILNDAISILAGFLDRNPQCGACGSNLLNAEMNPTRSFRRRFPDNLWLLDLILTGNNIEKLYYKRNLFFNTTQNPLEVSYIVGADLMARAEVIHELNGFDKDFFMYYEEIELCFRIKKLGFTIVSIPTAKIQHLEGKSLSNVEFKASQMYRSLRLYFEKTLNRSNFKISRFLYLILAAQRYIIYFISSSNLKRRYWEIQLTNYLKK